MKTYNCHVSNFVNGDGFSVVIYYIRYFFIHLIRDRVTNDKTSEYLIFCLRPKITENWS